MVIINLIQIGGDHGSWYRLVVIMKRLYRLVVIMVPDTDWWWSWNVYTDWWWSWYLIQIIDDNGIWYRLVVILVHDSTRSKSIEKYGVWENGDLHPIYHCLKELVKKADTWLRKTEANDLGSQKFHYTFFVTLDTTQRDRYFFKFEKLLLYCKFKLSEF